MKKSPIIVGHRGVGKKGFENSLSSFKRAIQLKLKKTELDVHLTKDNQLVVIHDKTLKRVSNAKGLIKNKTLEELKKFHLKNNEEIPTLQEVINICKGKIILQIELKDLGTAEKVNDLILQNRIQKKVTVISFKKTVLKNFKKLNKKIPTGILFDKETPKVWKIAKELNLDYLGPRADAVTREMIEKAHKQNRKVYCYACNNKRLAQKLIDYNIDEIGTDYPIKIKKLT